jgi:hypothetical protein
VTNYFYQFDSTPANVVADIKTNILLSSDWSNPAGQRVLCTTTRGADMCVDLADSAATATGMTLAAYRTSGLADKTNRYIAWRGSGGATSDTVHVMLSVGKEHLFIAVEGPRAGETNAVSATNGSCRQPFFIGDIVPYFAADTVATVLLIGQTVSATSIYGTGKCHVGRNQANSSSWVQAKLATLCFPACDLTSSTVSWLSANHLASDGNTYLWPYVVIEDTAGMRGRVSKCFFLGGNGGIAGSDGFDNFTPTFAKYTIGSETFIAIPPQRGGALITPNVTRTAFGSSNNSTAADMGPLIAVPSA